MCSKRTKFSKLNECECTRYKELQDFNLLAQECAADLAQRLELPSQLVEYLAGMRVTDIGGTDLNFRAYISHMFPGMPEHALQPGYDKIACKWMLVDLPCEGNEGRAKRSVPAAVYKDDWEKHGQRMENATLLLHDAGQYLLKGQALSLHRGISCKRFRIRLHPYLGPCRPDACV